LEMAAVRGSESSHDPHTKGKTFDIFFCGVAYKNRVQTVERCLPALLPYRSLFVGPGWEVFSGRCPDLVVLDRLGYDEVLSHYLRDHVLLSISRHFSLGDHKNRPGLSPTPRAFELAALGSCQIAAEPFDPEYACFTEEEIPRFSTSDSLAAHLSYFLDPLAGSERRRSTGDHAKRRALDYHLYRYRLDRIGAWAQTI
jgi:spore maturation protein CgeB